MAVGVFTTHIDDILGCGVHGILECTRKFLQKRFGGLKLQESDFVHVGMELSQGSDFSVRLTQLAFTGNLLPMDTSPILWADRQKPLDDENKLRCQCKLGELCWLAPVSKPDICASLANIASRANALQGSDIYRINDLIKTIKLWQPRTVLKYESSSNPLFPPTGDSLGRFRARGERLHKGTLTLAGWSDAAYGGLSEEGRCRLGYIIGLMSSSLSPAPVMFFSGHRSSLGNL